jgi:hypothetical protein
MGDSDFISRARDSLMELRQRDPTGKRVFGASAHRYDLHPRVPESTLARFEGAHSIQLPLDYRAFLAELGNGGAGPYYGVFKLGEMDDNAHFKRWKPGKFVGSPSRPFPYEKQWNLQAPDLQRLRGSEEDDELLRTYWTAIDGAIPICHEGCALRDWLVVSGPQAGHVWHDARADFDGWSPGTQAGGGHMTFAAWYLSWLDEALRITRVDG